MKQNTFWCILKATESSFLHLYPVASSSSNIVPCHIGGQGRDLGFFSLPKCRTVPEKNAKNK